MRPTNNQHNPMRAIRDMAEYMILEDKRMVTYEGSYSKKLEPVLRFMAGVVRVEAVFLLCTALYAAFCNSLAHIVFGVSRDWKKLRVDK